MYLQLIASQPDIDYPINKQKFERKCTLDGLPRLTLRMTARIQAFPDSWIFAGGKTATYRQIGNAFPAPVSEAVGKAILSALTGHKQASQDTLYEYPRLF